MSLEENKAIIRRRLAALDRHDFGALGDHPGLYQTVARQPMIRTSFPDLQTTIEQQIAEGDTVATRATMRGTHLGEFMGVAPTEKQFTITVLLMNKIESDRLAPRECRLDWRVGQARCRACSAVGSETVGENTSTSRVPREHRDAGRGQPRHVNAR